ncbi:hypothetical protein BpHYR1_041225 [Brachionus plicatilis]|uniref:Uncharacterized protein n=1 Tax=Brachionus plicatilis TaxID=10195 RepID=A0A3M7PQC0_BRAPC|nr:hypothetical protein BpHYR1_041225 [Brachionus plicatilis]
MTVAAIGTRSCRSPPLSNTVPEPMYFLRFLALMQWEASRSNVVQKRSCSKSVKKVCVVVEQVFAREQNVVDEQVARHYLLVALKLEQIFDQVYDVELEALRHFVAACGHAGQQV